MSYIRVICVNQRKTGIQITVTVMTFSVNFFKFFLIVLLSFSFCFFGPCDYSGALIYWCCEWELTVHNVGE